MLLDNWRPFWGPGRLARENINKASAMEKLVDEMGQELQDARQVNKGIMAEMVAICIVAL